MNTACILHKIVIVIIVLTIFPLVRFWVILSTKCAKMAQLHCYIFIIFLDIVVPLDDSVEFLDSHHNVVMLCQLNFVIQLDLLGKFTNQRVFEL